MWERSRTAKGKRWGGKPGANARGTGAGRRTYIQAERANIYIKER